MQNHYSLLYREEEREMMPTLKVSFASSMVTSWYLNRLLAFRRRLYSLECPGPWYFNPPPRC